MDKPKTAAAIFPELAKREEQRSARRAAPQPAARTRKTPSQAGRQVVRSQPSQAGRQAPKKPAKAAPKHDPIAKGYIKL